MLTLPDIKPNGTLQSTQRIPKNTQETTKSTQESPKSTQETPKSTQDSQEHPGPPQVELQLATHHLTDLEPPGYQQNGN